MIYCHPGRVRRRRVEKLLSHGQMMMLLFIVLFQKQTLYTFVKGTRDVTKNPG